WPTRSNNITGELLHSSAEMASCVHRIERLIRIRRRNLGARHSLVWLGNRASAIWKYVVESRSAKNGNETPSMCKNGRSARRFGLLLQSVDEFRWFSSVMLS